MLLALVIKSAGFSVTIVIIGRSSLMQIQCKTFQCDASGDVLQVTSIVQGWDGEEFLVLEADSTQMTDRAEQIKLKPRCCHLNNILLDNSV